MKTMCPPGYHHSGFVATHALQHMMFSSCAQVHELPQNCCGDNREGTLYILNIHIYIGADWEQKEHWNLSNPPPTPPQQGPGVEPMEIFQRFIFGITWNWLFQLPNFSPLTIKYMNLP